MANKAQEMVFIIHKIQKGKPKKMLKSKWEKSIEYMRKDGWRLARESEITPYYDIKPVEEKKAPAKKKEEKKEG